MLTKVCSIFVGTDTNRQDFADIHGMEKLTNGIIKDIDNFAAKVYHKYNDQMERKQKAYHESYLAIKEHRKWALPGTEKKHYAGEIPISSEPASAVPSCLKTVLCVNSTQPSPHANSPQPSPHANLAQSSHANSAQPSPHANSAQLSPRANSTQPSRKQGSVEHPETPEPNTDQPHFHSPASIATHDPGFNDMHMSSSPAPSKVDESPEDWEKDKTLLPQEWVEIG